jgi:hypothetical protein
MDIKRRFLFFILFFALEKERDKSQNELKKKGLKFSKSELILIRLLLSIGIK